MSHAALRQLGLDETTLQRCHEYPSLFVYLDDSQVLFATEGRDAGGFGAFQEDLKTHAGSLGRRPAP